MDALNNLFTNIPTNLREELVETILRTSSFRIERIVSRGHRSPDSVWYDQDEHEWIILLQGSAAIRFEDQCEDIIMTPGSCININKHRRHRVEWTDSEQMTIWLAIYYQMSNKKD